MYTPALWSLFQKRPPDTERITLRSFLYLQSAILWDTMRFLSTFVARLGVIMQLQSLFFKLQVPIPTVNNFHQTALYIHLRYGMLCYENVSRKERTLLSKDSSMAVQSWNKKRTAKYLWAVVDVILYSFTNSPTVGSNSSHISDLFHQNELMALCIEKLYRNLDDLHRKIVLFAFYSLALRHIFRLFLETVAILAAFIISYMIPAVCGGSEGFDSRYKFSCLLPKIFCLVSCSSVPSAFVFMLIIILHRNSIFSSARFPISMLCTMHSSSFLRRNYLENSYLQQSLPRLFC